MIFCPSRTVTERNVSGSTVLSFTRLPSSSAPTTNTPASSPLVIVRGFRTGWAQASGTPINATRRSSAPGRSAVRRWSLKVNESFCCAATVTNFRPSGAATANSSLPSCAESLPLPPSNAARICKVPIAASSAPSFSSLEIWPFSVPAAVAALVSMLKVKFPSPANATSGKPKPLNTAASCSLRTASPHVPMRVGLPAA